MVLVTTEDKKYTMKLGFGMKFLKKLSSVCWWRKYPD